MSQRHEELKVAIFTSSSTKSLLCLLAEIFNPLEQRPLVQQNLVCGNRKQNFASGLLGVIMRGATVSHFLPLIPVFMNIGYRRTALYFGFWVRANTASWRTSHQLCKALPLGAVAKSSKSCLTIISTQLLPDGEEHGNTSEFHEQKPFATLLLL